ncbi:MAG: DsrH/TusB family sulfur metabolism protein [Thermodesulfovibrionales bacterium]|nr:DsrH/TusB family sulfur metabolism protein [Thermodesulfovibrionales bacterium]
MIVIIKSSPDTAEGGRGLKLARDMAADICLIQGGVYFAEKERLEGFCGTVYALEEDLRMRGIRDLEKGVIPIGYDGLTDLAAENDKVVGAF